MCRRSCETGRFIARFTLRSEGEPPERFFVNAGLTAAEYPLFFAPEVVHFVSELRNHFGGLFRSLKSAFGA
jgi:hypothetical protein